MKFRVISLLLFTSLYGVDFDYRGDVKLKKDEYYQLNIKSDRTKVLKFRWTLYVNNELVFLHKYDNFNAHNMLTLEHKRNLVRFKVASSRNRFLEDSFMYIKFKDFDHNKSEATFELLMRDKNKNVELEFIKND